MIPVSWFIVYNDEDVVALLKPERKGDLLAKVASLHGFGGADPTDDEIRQQMEQRGQGALWPSYKAVHDREDAARSAGDGALATCSPMRPEHSGPLASGRLVVRAAQGSRSGQPPPSWLRT
jgi:hypothetical protein